MNKRKRSTFQIMKKLIVMILPLFKEMLVAIFSGCIAFFSTFGLTAFSTILIANFIGQSMGNGILIDISNQRLVGLMILSVILRGFFRYLEQYMNHLIAFKVLQVIRHKVFAAVRNLAPSNIEKVSKGDLISLIAGDIELLEVFYAHTISPVSIAVITGIVYVVLFAKVSLAFSLVALLSYLCIGVILPLIFSKLSNKNAMKFRQAIGKLNGGYLDILRGLLEIIQYNYQEKAKKRIIAINKDLSKAQSRLINYLSILLGLIDFLSVFWTIIFIVVGFSLQINPLLILISSVCLFFSFGAVSAVALLGNGLSQTLACGDRVLDLLEEKPLTEMITQGKNVPVDMPKDSILISVKNISFAYRNNQEGDIFTKDVLKNMSFDVRTGEILGLQGASGCGKSTLLKLLMRFWEVSAGTIKINHTDINEINTNSLWENISYMTQKTEFFDGSIRDNLKIAKDDATDEEIKVALKKASILDFIDSLERGLDTKINELGDNFSGGERQRFGLARVFLKDSPILLLDEPTSNLDSLNENMILQLIKDNQQEKTIILVSHRPSTLKVCDRIIEI